MKSTHRCLAGALLLSCGMAAHAQPVDLRPQISVLYSHVFEDAARGDEAGQGAYLGLGWELSERWGMEIGGFWHDYDASADRVGTLREWKEWGGNIDAHLYFTRHRGFTPYMIIGGGVLRSEDRIADTRSTDPFAQVGFGFRSLLGANFGIRGDAVFRYADVSDRHAISRNAFREPVVRLGFFVPLGAEPKPEPPPPPPPPPRQAPPPPPPPPPPPQPREVIHEIDQTVMFGFDSATIQSRAEPELMRIARLINEDTTLRRVEVAGHTDSTGPREYNVKLSERRAQAVRDFLVSRGGVDSRLLTVKGYGPDRPKVSNDTLENRKKNRRVELIATERNR